jgi:hypothetical protein
MKRMLLKLKDWAKDSTVIKTRFIDIEISNGIMLVLCILLIIKSVTKIASYF